MREIISIAPGRTCLFGDHQDYLGLPIIACAINRHITLKARENNSNNFIINLPDINQTRIIPISEKALNLEKEDFFMSALKVLQRYHCIPNTGYEIEITGSIPINAGVSSSSALVVTWVQFLLKAFGPNELLTPESVGQLTFESEVLEFHNPGGKMDQFSIGIGNIIYLETGNDFSYEVLQAPLSGLILAESGVPKETIGLLKRVKENAWKAITEVQKRIPEFKIEESKVEDLEMYLSFLTDDLKPYLEAAIGNFNITKKALLEFKKEVLDLQEIGDLMNQHHHYLKNLLKITVPKIDTMIDAALNAGALGAKIVGSGGGGSIAVISPKNKEAQIIKAILNAGAKDAYCVAVAKGANVSEINLLK
ncbi:MULTISPECIES: mevalonate kinase [unclassified Polaribacter]|uniref:mevalonate kinase family protein n=1 Tax=unclassified Polaribacter TaxID=196858 RepID=UPI00052BA568|nr:MULTISPECIES: galactokinase family protein [unclassified Polaribacter]KGL60492.1 mevalonate kinase [Polaribacter sp. Hel1_33_49]PKV65210.1 galactokinase [Polaribacter sp. Hel1_33_96]